MPARRDGERLKEHMRDQAGRWPGLELLLQTTEEAGSTTWQAMTALRSVT